jgi:hypothetical protein
VADIKPLNWTPKPGVGMTVARRPDGGMTLTFTDLFGMEGRTRNLYDLRQVKHLDEKAVRTAVEVNSDPSARNIRLAVLVASGEAADAIRKIAALALPETAAAVKLFTDPAEAEVWLSRPLDQFP